ncbi:hypothetical protein [Microvirgula aerodenitrificans]|uniref:hypothetical protein n=1 Tax=Microvirgula aerodenitrificans TaxID=57480 RepID=UPI0028EA17B8|nr:hypothetical protein [Microvirgula aerodenitrificans]
MILTADQVRPGPHWVPSGWVLMVIENPSALLYGLAGADFYPIAMPTDARWHRRQWLLSTQSGPQGSIAIGMAPGYDFAFIIHSPHGTLTGN